MLSLLSAHAHMRIEALAMANEVPASAVCQFIVDHGAVRSVDGPVLAWSLRDSPGRLLLKSNL